LEVLQIFMKKKKSKKTRGPARPVAYDILGYPSCISGYERESLAAEAVLAAERKAKRSGPVAKEVRPKGHSEKDHRRMKK
jgi:hypothetical protein